MNLDHVTIRTRDLEATRSFLLTVFDLEEGPRLQTNVEGCEEDELQIGMALVVDYRVETDEVTVPVFRPAR